MDDSTSTSDKKFPAGKPASPGVGTPFAGESSASNIPVPPPDSTNSSNTYDPEVTIVDAGPRFDSGATLVDAATVVPLAPKNPVLRSPAPPSGPVSVTPHSAAVLQIGQLLGERYEILQLLGEGGMGAVYKAADHELDRYVALKEIGRASCRERG